MKKSSMLYRSAEFHGSIWGNEFKASNDLCTFIRRYLWSVVRNTITLFILLFSVIGLVWDVVSFFQHGYTIPTYNYFMAAGLVAIWVVCVVVGSLAAIFILYFSEQVKDKIVNKFTNTTKTTKNDSVIAAYYRSKRDKYCARIDFTD